MKTLALTTAALLIIGSSAVAQNANADANANAASGSYSQSGSLSQGGSVYITNNGGGTTRYDGSYDVKNVPSASAPGIITAHNCALGASVGGSWLGGGVSLGGSYADENCVLISEAAALNTLVGADVAVRHLARDPEMCKTLRSAGKISANSTCGEPARKQPRSTASATAASSSGATAVGYSKCYKRDDGRIGIKYKAGTNKVSAKAACLASLGY